MATNGMDRAFVTPLELALLPPLYKSTITSARLYCLLISTEGSSTANGSVDTDALSIIKALVTRSYTASAAIPVVENSF